MKSVGKNRTSFILEALLSVFLLWGCGHDGTGSVAVPPSQQSAERVAVNLAVVDPVNGAPIGVAAVGGVAPAAAGAVFSVTVTGPDADKIFDGDGNSMYNSVTKAAGPFTGVQGFLTFYIRAKAADYPLNMQVLVKNDHYVTNSKTLFIPRPTSTDPLEIPVKIMMTKADLFGADRTALNGIGIDVKSEPVNTDPTGKTTAVVNITTRSIETTKGTGAAELSIPAGTGLTTADGQPVTGALNATVSYFEPIEVSSLVTFPGGMYIREQPDGTLFSAGQVPGTFVSGGFASIEVRDASGKVVRNFDNPVVVTMTVPKGLINPSTGLPIAAGDVIPLWSYNTDTGEWTVHKDSAGTIIKGKVGDADGDFVVDLPPASDNDGDWIVAFKTTHLSYFNLDWFFWSQTAPQYPKNMCDSTDLTVAGAQGRRISFRAEAVGGGFTHDAYLDANPAAPASETVTITYAPKIPMKYTAYLDYETPANKLNSQVFNNICASGNVFTIADPNNIFNTKTSVDVTVNVYDQCTNDPSVVTPIPANGIYAYEIANKANFETALTDVNGAAVLKSLEVWKTYTVEAANRQGGASQSAELTVTPPSPPGGFQEPWQQGNMGNVVNLYFPKHCKVITGTGGTGGTGGNGL